MTIPLYAIPSGVSSLFLLAIGIFVLTRHLRSLPHQSFALTFFASAVTEFSYFMLFMTREFIWTKIALLGLCVLPGSLAIFSLTFAPKHLQT